MKGKVGLLSMVELCVVNKIGVSAYTVLLRAVSQTRKLYSCHAVELMAAPDFADDKCGSILWLMHLCTFVERRSF